MSREGPPKRIMTAAKFPLLILGHDSLSLVILLEVDISLPDQMLFPY